MGLTFICGPDEFRVERAGKAAWAQLCEAVEEAHNREVYDGRAGNVAEVEATVSAVLGAVQTLSLFGGAKAVWLRAANFLADSVTGRAEGTLKQVERLQAALTPVPEGVELLITAVPVDRRRKSFKWFQSNSQYTFIEADARGEDAIPLLVQEAGAQGLSLTPALAQQILAQVQGNLRLAVLEVAKLATYLDGGGAVELDERLVLEQVPAFGESDFFEPVEAFYRGDLDWTLQALERYFFAGRDGRPLLTTWQNRNRLALQLTALKEAGLLRGRVQKAGLEQALDRLGVDAGGTAKSAFNLRSQNPFYLGRLAQLPAVFDRSRLERLQHELFFVFVGMLDAPNEQPALFRQLALRHLGPAAAA